jgi:hypothetical protein
MKLYGPSSEINVPCSWIIIITLQGCLRSQNITFILGRLYKVYSMYRILSSAFSHSVRLVSSLMDKVASQTAGTLFKLASSIIKWHTWEAMLVVPTLHSVLGRPWLAPTPFNRFLIRWTMNQGITHSCRYQDTMKRDKNRSLCVLLIKLTYWKF